MYPFGAGGSLRTRFSKDSLQIFWNGKANLSFCTKKFLVKSLRVLKLSLFILLYYWRTDIHVFQFAWCWCFMEYLIFSTFSIQRFKNTKSSFGFVPNIGYLGLMDIKIVLIYKFYTMGRQAYLQLVLSRVLVFHHKFSTQ